MVMTDVRLEPMAPTWIRVVRCSTLLIHGCRKIARKGVTPTPCASMTAAGAAGSGVKFAMGPNSRTVEPTVSAARARLKRLCEPRFVPSVTRSSYGADATVNGLIPPPGTSHSPGCPAW